MTRKIACLFMALAMITTIFIAMPVSVQAAGDTYTTISASGSFRTSGGIYPSLQGGGVSAAVKSDNTLWAWGDIGYFDPWNPQVTPKKMMDDVVSVSTSIGNIFAVKTDGSLWGMGGNNDGQLGAGTSGASHDFVKIMDDVVSVSSGAVGTVAIKSDASLWGWGWVPDVDSLEPVKIFDNVADVSLGMQTIYAIKTDGSLWVNGSGYTGLGENISAVGWTMLMKDVISVSTYSEGEFTLALQNDGTVWAWGINHYGIMGAENTDDIYYTPVHVMDDVKAISAGRYHAMAIKSDDTLWAWGSNARGAVLGLGQDITHSAMPQQVMSDVAAVSAGGEHTLAIKTDGTLWAWGQNLYQQIGNGEGGFYWVSGFPIPYCESTPVQIISDTMIPSYEHRPDIEDEEDIPIAPPVDYDFADIGAVSASLGSWAVIDKEGVVWTQEGKTEFKDAVFVVADYYSYFAIKTDGTLWAWGKNDSGQLGDGTAIDRSEPVQILEDVVFVTSREGYAAAIKTDGTLWCWRKLYEEKPQRVMENVEGEFVFVATAWDNMLAITSDNKLWTTKMTSGSGRQIIENNGFGLKRLDNVARVAISRNNALVITFGGELCVMDILGEGGGEIDLSQEPVILMQNIKGVACDEYGYDAESEHWEERGSHFAVIQSDNSLWVWGANGQGQLGTGDTDAREEPIKIMDDVVQVAVGNGNTIAQKSDGSIWLWGNGVSVPTQVATDENAAAPQPGISENEAAPADTDNARSIPIPFIVGGAVLIVGIIVAVIVIVSSEKKKKQRR